MLSRSGRCRKSTLGRRCADCRALWCSDTRLTWASTPPRYGQLGRLVPPLIALHRDSQLELVARDVTAAILARFAADGPETLVDVIVTADPGGFRLILPALQKQATATLPRLEEIANSPPNFAQLAGELASQTRHDVERSYDEAERRQATAMIAMWRLGNRANALEAMRAPRTRPSEPG